MACLMAEAPVQVQKACFRSCDACVARDEAAACCQPHGNAVPRFMGLPWPPAPTTPFWSRRHRTSSCSPMGASIYGVLALGAPLLWPGLWGLGSILSVGGSKRRKKGKKMQTVKNHSPH